MLTGFIIIKN